MKTTALVEKGKDGRFGVFTPELSSTIIGEGATAAEAKEDFCNSYIELISSFSEQELPSELKNLEFEYKYDIASIFDYFDWINVSAFARHAGLNSSLLHQYKKKSTYVSQKQMKRIESALHSLGAELCSSVL